MSRITDAPVIRYVATYVGRDGLRTLMTAAQGRNTYETPEQAQAWIDAVRANNAPANLASIWGADTFEVRPVECYAGHFDPMGVYFD